MYMRLNGAFSISADPSPSSRLSVGLRLRLLGIFGKRNLRCREPGVQSSPVTVSPGGPKTSISTAPFSRSVSVGALGEARRTKPSRSVPELGRIARGLISTRMESLAIGVCRI